MLKHQRPIPTPAVTATVIHKTQGLSLEAARVVKVQKVQVNHVQAIQVRTENTQGFSSTSQLLLICFGLLLAAVIALLGVKMGLTVPAPVRTQHIDPITPLPAFFSNEVLPLIEQRSQWQPLPLTPWQQPAATPVETLVPQFAFAASVPTGSHLPTQYHDSPRRVVLLPSKGPKSVEQNTGLDQDAARAIH